MVRNLRRAASGETRKVFDADVLGGLSPGRCVDVSRMTDAA
jgi:hypothetical protein